MTVWSPPAPHSWDALISIYIGRVVHTLDVAVSAIYGLFDFVANRGHGDLAEWAGEWGGRVEDWVRWAAEGVQVPTPHERWSKILTEYGLADAVRPPISLLDPAAHHGMQSSRQLMGELQTLDNFVERLNSGSPPPPLSTLRFSGLRDVENRYTRSSRQFRGAATLLATMLSAATNATLSAHPDATIALLAIPVGSHKSIGRHTHSSLLAPFKTSERSFGASVQLERRGQVFGERQDASSPVPIISSSRKCYDSEDECGDQTGSCNGHGSCVQGKKTTGGSCYVCQCSSTSDEDTGSTTYWSGETCEKQDVSRSVPSPFLDDVSHSQRTATLSSSSGRPSACSSSSPPASPRSTASEAKSSPNSSRASAAATRSRTRAFSVCPDATDVRLESEIATRLPYMGEGGWHQASSDNRFEAVRPGVCGAGVVVPLRLLCSCRSSSSRAWSFGTSMSFCSIDCMAPSSVPVDAKGMGGRTCFSSCRASRFSASSSVKQ